jgi:hypothetical protein
MMKLKLMFLTTVLSIATLLILVPSAARADSLTFTANLTGSLEVPSVNSNGTGFATVVIDTSANTLFVNVSFSGLSSGTTASHIHCCVASPFLNANAGVATQTPTFLNLPLGVTAGSFTETLDLTLASSYNPAFVTLEGGTVSGAEAALIAGIENGESYLNIHTTQNPGGEIRGLLATPEPTSLLMLGTGFLALLGIRRRFQN